MAGLEFNEFRQRVALMDSDSLWSRIHDYSGLPNSADYSPPKSGWGVKKKFFWMHLSFRIFRRFGLKRAHFSLSGEELS
ncbi:hypothetical protein AB1287_00080 [Enterobacter asburiae]|uniref:hypothetical protein n=1 Tax=Scandinavium sp. UTDF21-P1B TaxID=3446379 RepID=UPI003490358B